MGYLPRLGGNMETMLTNVLREQEIALSIIEKRKMLFKPVLQNLNNKDFKRIIIYATGSSSNAAYCAKLYMQKILKIPVDIQEPSMAKNYELFFDHEALYFAISQSGNSYSTIEVVKEAQRMGIKDLFTLTSDIKSPIAEVSKHVLDMGIGIESVAFVTLGVMATTLYFDLLAVELAFLLGNMSEEDYNSEINSIKYAVTRINPTIELANDWYDRNKEKFYQSRRFVAIGYGPSYGVVREADTKITETVRVPMNGHELEEYMHGPYIGLNKNDYIIMINPYGVLHERMSRLRKFLNDHVDNVFMITNTGNIQNENNDLALDFNVNEYLSPLYMLVPIHVMSYKLSEYHNIDLTKSSYPDFDVTMKSKVNN